MMRFTVVLCCGLAACGSSSTPSEDGSVVDLQPAGKDLVHLPDLGGPDLLPVEDLSPVEDLTDPGDMTVLPDLVDPKGWVLNPTAPLSAAMPTWAVVDHAQPPSALLATATAPLPTNTWWMNLILDKGDARVYVAPYTVKALDVGLAVDGPKLNVTADGESTADSTALTFGTSELIIKRAVTAHDALSATVNFTADKGVGNLIFPLVPGSPYISALYFDTTPTLTPGEGISIVSVNGGQVSPLTEARFEIVLDNGQTWLMYSMRPIYFEWNASGMISNLPWAGPIRLALRTSDKAAALLDADWATVPLGGHVEAEVGGDTGTVRLVWQIEGPGPLLMLTLPHHRAAGVGMAGADPSFSTVAGTMLPVEGNPMVLTYPLSTIGWAAPRAVDPNHQADVVAQLATDLPYAPDPTAADSDPYEGPRQMHALARLAQIADDLGDAGSSTTLRARLQPLVEAWLDGKNGDPLVYDHTWGGVITTHGNAGVGNDGGNGYYQNHHVMYGYLLAAAAVLAHDDAAWATKYQKALTLLVRDIANPATNDSLFTQFRNMDFYYGHGWGTGLVASSDGPTMMSSTEAANAWYAIRLLGDVYSDPVLTGLGRLLLAMETLSAQTYFQVPTASTVYQKPFSDGHVVGELWSTKVNLASALGPSATYSYSDQLRPFTPASEAVLGMIWAGDVAPQLVAAATAMDAVPDWIGYLYEGQAVTDKAAAWTALDGVTKWEPGTTKTNALWWAATRP